MESGKFRKKRKNFAQVSNIALTDKTLSLKAKGLYALIESYISIPDFILYKQTLMNSCAEGVDAFNTAWKELKNAGYLKQYKIQTQGGFSYEYELLDEPNKEDSPTYGFSTPGETTHGEVTSGQPTDGKVGAYNNSQENNTDTNNNLVNNNDNTVANNSSSSVVENDNNTSKSELISKFNVQANLILGKNKSFKSMDDPLVKSYVRAGSNNQIYCDYFDSHIAGPSSNTYMYDLSAILNNYLVMSEAMNSNTNPLKAKELMDKTLLSFPSVTDKLAIINLSSKAIGDIYFEAIKLVEEGSQVNNKQAYLSQIVRANITQEINLGGNGNEIK